MKLARSSPCVPQIGDPLGVLHVRLAPGHGLELLGIDHQKLKIGFQQVVDGSPIHPGGFHRQMGTALRLQPIAQV
jgi:hypothetical protein